MSTTLEIITWLVITIISFCIFNTFLSLRTASSIFLSFLVSAIITIFIFNTIYGEIVLNFALLVGILYAIVKALRDYRDDFYSKAIKN